MSENREEEREIKGCNGDSLIEGGGLVAVRRYDIIPGYSVRGADHSPACRDTCRMYGWNHLNMKVLGIIYFFCYCIMDKF